MEGHNWHMRVGVFLAPVHLGKGRQSQGRKLKAKGKPADLEELIRMEADRGTTNVRKLTFPHWKRWFGIEHRCLVPVTSFAEPDPASQQPGGTCRTPGLHGTRKSR